MLKKTLHLSRVSPNFRLKRKEAKRKRKKRKRNSEKKKFVSLRFAKKRKQFFDAKMKLIRSEKTSGKMELKSSVADLG
jgi:hypothetical protein